jgi:hypothetical protein
MAELSVKETKVVPLSELNPYPANPRIGDIELIEESVRRHGQYRAMVVNERNMQVLAGNHLLHAMLGVGMKEGLAHFVDVDEDEAKRIVLVDNRASDMAKYDDQQLQNLITSLDGDYAGTGWDETAFRKLTQKLYQQENERLRDWAERYEVVVECDGEDQQREVYERFQAEGYKCRVLTL